MDVVHRARRCLEPYPRGDTCPGEAKLGDSASTPSIIGISFSSNRLRQSRADHQRRLVEFLDDVLETIDVPLLPRPAMILDYVPYIQWMVEIDDAHAEMTKNALLLGSSEGGGRIVSLGRRGAVRQSSRIGARVPTTHERYISLSEEGLHAARGSRLVV